MTNSTPPEPRCLGIIIPVYNEADVLNAATARLLAVLEALPLSHRVLFVDDGSTDGSGALLRQLCQQHKQVGFIRLSRNFGKEAAMLAGLDNINADAVIILDADMQDPPELIPAMVEQWQAGFDMVTMRRRLRDGETRFKKSSAWLFYRFLHRVSEVHIPTDTGDFRLLSRRAADAVRQLTERQRYSKGLFAWIGFPQTELVYDRESRNGGDSKWRWAKLMALAVDGITAFSSAPLRWATFLGLSVSLSAFGFAIWTLLKTLVFGDPVAGYPTLLLTILFLGGVQLLSIGILGEYIGRLFVEAKQRPAYLIQEQQWPVADKDTDTATALAPTEPHPHAN